LGWTWTPTMAIGQGCRVHLRSDELPGGRLILSISRHVVAVIDGVTHDTYDPSRGGARCVYGYYSQPVDLMLDWAGPNQGRRQVAVKTVRVSDLSGKQADEDALAKLVIHEHPQYQGPITLDVLPDEVGELPESESYVSIEVIQPGHRSGQRALLSLDHFNKLAGGKDMNAILIEAVAATRPQRGPAETPRRRRASTSGRGKTNYATMEHAGEPHRGRITDAEKELVRNNLDEVNERLARQGMRTIDPNDPAMKERYGL
jgi:hypothetical protein